MTPANILVVEDERIIAIGIEKRLKGMGYVVLGLASNAEDALRLATALQPDIVLMDINLGRGMDGIEAAALIRSRLNLPVVYLTAHSDDATLQRAKVTEPFGYVLKPYEDSDLQTAIEIGLYKHRMERRLRENEQWLAATLGSIGDGVIATNELGNVRFMNGLAEGLTGWSQADALGRDVQEVFHIIGEKTRQRTVNPIFEALEKGEPATLAPNTVLIGKDGIERPIDDSAAPIRDVGGSTVGAVLVFRDITERRRLEEHLREAQRMEAIGRLAGGIAHDFNNIMTVITGYTDLLLDKGLDFEAGAEFLRQINIAGKRAAALTQQILAFSRKQMLVRSVLNLNSIVRDMFVMVQRLIGEHIEFETNLAADLGRVKADPTQLGQVLLNLALNARDAMPDGGKLIISTSNVKLDERTIQGYPEVKPGQYVLMEVSDTGRGIAPDAMVHVFEPFYTTKEVGSGTGLGLATVYGIVKQSEGHVEVSSVVGAGTTFRIYLPRTENPGPGTSNGAERQALGGDETILLVEDEESIRQMMGLILQQYGYTVLEAKHGPDGLNTSDRHKGPIHLLVTDLVMPQLSGRMLAEKLMATRPETKVVFMSGYTEDIVVRQGVDSARVNFLPKPFAVEDLAKKVRKVLDGR